MIIHFLVLLSFLAGFITADNGINLVRGVEIKNQAFYDSNQDFTCLDGSKTIPFSSVNDDYCDCVDASDEPGTSACPEGKYFCQNLGHKSLYLQSSRVNDGICDCCDGSDEYDSDVACFNGCEEFGKEEMIRLQMIKEEHNEGTEVRKTYVETGAQRKNEKQARADILNKMLEERRAKLEELKAAKDAAEAPEKEAKEKHDKVWEEVKAKKKEEQDNQERAEVFSILDLDKNGWVSFGELMAHPNLNADMSEEEAKEALGGEALVNPEGFPAVWETLKAKFLKVGRSAPTEEITATGEEVVGESEEGGTKDEEKKPEETEGKPEYDESTKQLIEIADEARKFHNDAESELRELESEQTTINNYLQIDFGPENEFAALKGECFEFTDREYVYKLCPFEKVTQKQKSGGSEQDLGHWGSWVTQGDYTKIKYDGGASCWNGPARSTLVKMSCGKTNDVTSVTEPSRCEYEMDFKTPALCVGDPHPAHTEL